MKSNVSTISTNFYFFKGNRKVLKQQLKLKIEKDFSDLIFLNFFLTTLYFILGILYSFFWSFFLNYRNIFVAVVGIISKVLVSFFTSL